MPNKFHDLRTREAVLSYLRQRSPAVVVLGTASPGGQPTTSPVYYAINDEGEIIVSSEIQTRKWQNLRENAKVALAFGMSLDQPSVQCEGHAELHQQGTKFEDIGEHYFSTVPEARKFSEGTMGLIRITPKNFRIVTCHPGTGPEVRGVS